jgi:hypothetical protein
MDVYRLLTKSTDVSTDQNVYGHWHRSKLDFGGGVKKCREMLKPRSSTLKSRSHLLAKP